MWYKYFGRHSRFPSGDCTLIAMKSFWTVFYNNSKDNYLIYQILQANYSSQKCHSTPTYLIKPSIHTCLHENFPTGFLISLLKYTCAIFRRKKYFPSGFIFTTCKPSHGKFSDGKFRFHHAKNPDGKNSQRILSVGIFHEYWKMRKNSKRNSWKQIVL